MDRYVDYRSVEVPEIPLLDKVIMGWDVKKAMVLARRRLAMRKYRQTKPGYLAKERERQRAYPSEQRARYDARKQANFRERMQTDPAYAADFRRKRNAYLAVRRAAGLLKRNLEKERIRRREIRQLKKEGKWPQANTI